MTQKLRVLIAEGTSGKVASALRALFPEEQGGLELTEVSGVSTLMASLKMISPEVILFDLACLFDLALTNSDVLGTVRLIHRTKPEVPLIVIGDPAEKEMAVASLRDRDGFLTLGSHIMETAKERNTLKGLADLLRDPGTGLYATAQKLTTNFRGLPVIFTSGYSQDSESVGAAAANAHYLQKPYRPMALGRQVRETLDQIQGGKPAK